MPISLTAGQQLELPIPPQSTIRLEVNWDADPSKALNRTHRPGDVPAENDLDANAILLNKQRQVLEVVWFRHRHASEGAVRLSGDDRTGDDQDTTGDESITVDLSDLDPQVATLVFSVNNYGQDGLAAIRAASCRLVDAHSGQEIAHADLTSQGSHNALILASLSRQEGGWTLRAIGVPTSGRTYWDTLPDVLNHL